MISLAGGVRAESGGCCWSEIPVLAKLDAEQRWVLQPAVSDDFNYVALGFAQGAGLNKAMDLRINVED